MRAVIAHDSCMSQFVYVNIPPPPAQSKLWTYDWVLRMFRV